MRMNEAFPSKYLNAADLEEGDLIVVITGAEYHDFPARQDKPKETKPVLLLDNEKPLILNKTNFKAIADLLGSDDTDDWVGQQITLTATQVESFGEQTMAIRVKLPRKPQAAPRPSLTQTTRSSQPRASAAPPVSRAHAVPMDDDIPF
jgi:hypothetical protein